MLSREATKRFIRGKEQVALRPLMRRVFDHGEMKEASKPFGAGSLPKNIALLLPQPPGKPKAALPAPVAPGRPEPPPLSKDVQRSVKSLAAALENRPGVETALADLVRALRPEQPRKEGELSGDLPAVPGELKKIAKAFVSLQEARHGADYDPKWRATRKEALRLIEEAEQAFTSWNAIKERKADQAITNLYLLCLFTFRRVRDR
ncbi:HEPN domain-containing protein [Sorangium cellulosum]|uniref:HEPN domain-containing protein n=1 Tax=Sorangium cellulosum TaxID=56 RepID=UPI0011DCE3F0|nr:HEPN domain-containing protein [Sorangium cellulosum]